MTGWLGGFLVDATVALVVFSAAYHYERRRG